MVHSSYQHSQPLLALPLAATLKTQKQELSKQVMCHLYHRKLQMPQRNQVHFRFWFESIQQLTSCCHAELLLPGDGAQNYIKLFVMADLCNRAGYYIFALWFVSSSFFSSPNLSGRRLNVYHTCTHGVALVRI